MHDEHFGRDNTVEDNEWLVAAGKRGWIVVSGDKRMIREPLFLRDLARSDAYVFILSDLNGLSAPKKAECIIEAYPKMLGLLTGAEKAVSLDF